MFPADIEAAADRLLKACRDRDLWVTTAESCTAGLLGAALTCAPGTSAVFDRGFITYSNAAKVALLDVPRALIEQYGAVSPEVARAMASGAKHKAGADIGIGLTGVAGPGGGSEGKPVGLVHFGLALPDGSVVHHEKRFGDIGRDRVRLEAVRYGLQLLIEAAS